MIGENFPCNKMVYAVNICWYSFEVINSILTGRAKSLIITLVVLPLLQPYCLRFGLTVLSFHDLFVYF